MIGMANSWKCKYYIFSCFLYNEQAKNTVESAVRTLTTTLDEKPPDIAHNIHPMIDGVRFLLESKITDDQLCLNSAW